MTQIAVRVDDELLGFVDVMRGGMSRSWYVKQLVVWAHEAWIADGAPTLAEDGPVDVRLGDEVVVVEPVRGPEPHQVIVDEVDPFPDHDSETRALVGERLPWQVDAERVSAQYRRDIEHLDRMIASAEPEPANPYLLP